MSKLVQKTVLKGMSIEITDNSPEVLRALENAIERGFEAIGIDAVGHAVDRLTETVYTRTEDPDGYKLTGRLRNSITYAVSGQPAAIESYSGDNGEEGGTYEGTAPVEENKAVYVGTNVVYAEGIELGTHRKAGAVHFLRDAAAGHNDEYKKLMKESLENA